LAILFVVINHRQIEAFRAVMVSGTATGAAVLLHTSQPVVSKLISRLQTSTGLKLFELRKGRLVPTPEARILFRTVERSYVGLEHIDHTIAELRGATAGRIRIGTLPSFGAGVLPKVVNAFLQTRPNVQVAIETVNSSLIRDSVVSGKLDLGITLKAIDTAGVHATPLVATSAVCVMPRGHRLAGKRVVKVQDLQDEALVMPSRDDPMRVSIESLFANHEVAPRIVAETTYAVTICMLALHGVGVALVTPLITPEFVKVGLVAKPFEPRLPIELLLLRPIDASLSRIAEQFLAELKNSLLT
jgi:DNA-binding transcriptional LysR family regulator